MRPRSLFGRLVLILVLGLVLAQALGLAIHHFDRERMFLRSNAAQTAQRISDIVSLLDTLEPSGREKVIAILNTRRWSASLSGTPLPLSTTPQDSGLTEFERAVKPLLSSRQHGVGMQQGTYSVSAQLAGGGWVTLGYRRDAVIVPNVLLWTWLALAIVIVIVTLVAARSVTKPLSVLANAAEALGRDIERPPLSETGPSEVKRAAHAFNTMQKRIRRFIADRARTFTAMSHDLKTPITRMRLRAEMLESPALKAKFTADLDEMQSMVDSSLAFMRGIEDEASKKVDVGALLESLKYDHEEIGHSVVIEGRALAPYYGKPLALKRLLNNLISNAVQYGGMATVVVADDSQELQILVCDCGPGIPEADLERVFEPFYRLETSRNRSSGGTGLGLSIGRDIARLHGGDIVLGNLPDGGLEATLTLPRYAQTQSMTSDFASGRKNHAPSPSPTPSPPSTPLRAGLEGNVGAVPAKAERWARPGVLESGARPGVLESGGDGAAGRKKR